MNAHSAALKHFEQQLTRINEGLKKTHEFSKPIMIHKKPMCIITSCKNCGLQLRETIDD